MLAAGALPAASRLYITNSNLSRLLRHHSLVVSRAQQFGVLSYPSVSHQQNPTLCIVPSSSDGHKSAHVTGAWASTGKNRPLARLRAGTARRAGGGWHSPGFDERGMVLMNKRKLSCTPTPGVEEALTHADPPPAKVPALVMSGEALRSSCSTCQPEPQQGGSGVIDLKPSPVPSEETSGNGETTFFRTVLKAVVKVFCTSTAPNYTMPWQMKFQTKTTASGFVIAGKRILTNAHAISHGSLIMVRKHGQAKKYVAKVLASAHEADIALLTVEDDTFWEGIVELELGEVPHLQEVVTCVGYPLGGDNVSVTRGVVSRLELQQYTHASYSLLAIQIDAAINSGNSGGPALMDDKVIGIAFETLNDAENIGYIIPTPVIRRFLNDIDRNEGVYTGFCDLGLMWQSMENRDMRDCLKMKQQQTGVYVSRLAPLSNVASVVEAGDILMEFDGMKIADDGTMPFRDGERILWTHLVTMKFVDDTCKLKLLRNGEEVEVTAKLGRSRHLVPVHLYDMKGPPPYFIYAGLVFLVVSQPLLRAQFGKDWECKAPLRMCEKAANGILEFEDQQVVMLSQVLAAEVNTGYQNLSNIEVLFVNGTMVRNLLHLAELISKNKEEYITLGLDKHKKVIISRNRAEESNPQILEQNCIPALCPKNFAASLAEKLEVATIAAPCNGTMPVVEVASAVQEEMPAAIAVVASKEDGDASSGAAAKEGEDMDVDSRANN